MGGARGESDPARLARTHHEAQLPPQNGALPSPQLWSEEKVCPSPLRPVHPSGAAFPPRSRAAAFRASAGGRRNGGRAAVRDSRRNSSSFRKWGFRNASMLGQFYGVAGGGCGVQSRQPSPRSTAFPQRWHVQTLSLDTRETMMATALRRAEIGERNIGRSGGRNSHSFPGCLAAIAASGRWRYTCTRRPG